MKFQALFSLAASIIPLARLVASEPIQYCRNGAETNEIDFCMSMLTHYNASTSAHDLFLTMSVLRPDSTPVGWTAIGLGEVMEGALMFIIYGDPLASKKPVVSIRKSIGHVQPTLITEEDKKDGAELHLLRADWQESPSDPRTVSAVMSVVCYSCHLFPGTKISATSKSQPWLWAWNNKQEFDDFPYDAHLKMHAHHAGKGGWGNFYVDMSRALNTWKSPPSPPSIIYGMKAIGVSESPGMSAAYGIAWLKNNPILHVHGILMGIAFLFLFPLGVLAMRSGRMKAFKYHWVIQLIASGFTVAGFALGLVLGRKVDTFHQILGITLVASLGLQGILGWRHHMVFLRLRRRTWLSHSHIYLGRFMMIGGWTNLVTGLVLRGYSRLSVGIMGFVVGFEAVALTAWLLWKRIKAARAERMNKSNPDGNKDDLTNYFALDDLDDDEEEEDASSSETLHDEESKPMMGKSEKA
ncbi:iron reductase domain protein [Annulohypoxylon maeteangense]|uniref:iron reductase domain protein n=1 Tax=Annulohypoxylon maeteangense TaxID=1927788 RepID=UPI002007C555|nr:iron reductase domain protein [Annulohypoxylon maeteangense]KAI0890160.1 iron reductase domain protein [Annulohypoxylon maeteangense]